MKKGEMDIISPSPPGTLGTWSDVKDALAYDTLLLEKEERKKNRNIENGSQKRRPDEKGQE